MALCKSTLYAELDESDFKAVFAMCGRKEGHKGLHQSLRINKGGKPVTIQWDIDGKVSVAAVRIE